MSSNILNLIAFLVISLSKPGLTPQADLLLPSDSQIIVQTTQDILLNVPFTHQINDLPETEKSYIRGTACGPAALTMILDYLGEDYTLSQVISKLPTSVYVKGDRFYNLYEGASYFAKETQKIKNTPTAIYETLVRGNPVILNVQNYDGITGHALVIVGMLGYNGDTAQALVIHDPFRGPYRIFNYASSTTTLKQPEGWDNYIGILEPFYLKNKTTLLSARI